MALKRVPDWSLFPLCCGARIDNDNKTFEALIDNAKNSLSDQDPNTYIQKILTLQRLAYVITNKEVPGSVKICEDTYYVASGESWELTEPFKQIKDWNVPFFIGDEDFPFPTPSVLALKAKNLIIFHGFCTQPYTLIPGKLESMLERHPAKPHVAILAGIQHEVNEHILTNRFGFVPLDRRISRKTRSKLTLMYKAAP